MNRRGEQGAVAVVVALVVCFVMLPLAAYTVDIGAQRVLRRDMQSIADVVALDMSRHLDGRTQAVIKATSDWRGGIADSVEDNLNLALNDGKAHTVTVQQQQETAIATVANSDLVVEVTMGLVDADGTFSSPIPYPDIPNAVRVKASSSIKGSFYGQAAGASRTAVATHSTPSVCFSVGTRTLALNTSQSALGPVLDNILKVRLEAVDYEGIVGLKDVSIPIADLMVQLDVGTLDQLATTNVDVGGFMLATANVLRDQGKTAAAGLLDAVKLGVPSLNVPLAEILDLSTAGDFGGLTADANVLDLLTAAIIAANGEHAVDANLPGVASVQITEPPQVACGSRDAVARSAQIRLRLNPTLPTDLISGLGLTSGQIDLTVEVGAGEARITGDLSCAPEQVTMAVTTGAVSILPPVAPNKGQVQVAMKLGAFMDRIPVLGLVLKLALLALGLDSVNLDVLVTGQVASTTETHTIGYPDPPALPDPLVVPEDGIGQTLVLSGTDVDLSVGQDGLLSLLNPVLDGTLSNVLGGVAVPLVNNVVNPLLTTVLSPLLDFLGIKLGVTEVTLQDRPKCQAVRLVG